MNSAVLSDAEFVSFLDRISIAFIDEDFDLWRDSISLPFAMVTKDGPVSLRTVGELEDNFNFYLEACRIMDLDRIYRTPLSLQDCADGSWIGTYKTHLLSKDRLATEPYISSALIEMHKDGPKMRSILNARGHHDWVGEGPNTAVYGDREPD